MNLKSIYIFVAIFALLSCSEDSNPLPVDTSDPKINKITTNKLDIMFGGTEYAIIACEALGGNLKYTWQVDLGDIIPINSSKSKIKFKASSCCIGNKTIKCIVSNDKGSTSEVINIRILEAPVAPDIFVIEPSKQVVKVGEKIDIKCYAIGGLLNFDWNVSCGSIQKVSDDDSKIRYTANADCVGTQTINCVVTNSAGQMGRTISIQVVE